jgi:hypothetical protein
MERSDIARKLANPANAFITPEEVLEQTDLTDDQKVEILRRWESQASQEAVALEEGMPGEESDLLRRILVAIGKLTGPLDVEHTGPAKEHGLPRSAIKRGE